MSQAIIKELRSDLAKLAKRQEAFEDKILAGGGSREDVEFFKTSAVSYAEEARKVRQKIMDLLSDPTAGVDVRESDEPASTDQVQ